MIYVTLGTMYLGFDRLVRAMDAIAHGAGERVVMQTGLSALVPQHAEHFDFRPRAELLALQREARVIVAHAGIGCVLDALQCGRPLIVAPRLRRYGEHNTDHQLELAAAVERRGWGRMALDMADLPALCAQPPAPPRDYRPDREALIASVRQFVIDAAERRPR